ncbi:MAG: hypothetical protein Q8K36_03525, partial [Alphaproteobacteria bacterium]|nr:hypothetical protein [Alphaproteobacteria bacterium]
MLAFDLEFGELYTLDGLTKLHNIFLNYIRDSSPRLYAQLSLAYANELDPLEADQLYVDLAPHVEDFISYLFDISEHVQINQQRHKFFSIVPKVKREFVQRYALREVCDTPPSEPSLDFPLSQADFDHAFAKAVFPYMQDVHTHKEQLRPFIQYVHWAVHTKEGQEKHQGSVLFEQPYKHTAQ